MTASEMYEADGRVFARCVYTATLEELHVLRALVEDDIDNIDDQLEGAHFAEHEGEVVNANWFHRAKLARRHKVKLLARVDRAIGQKDFSKELEKLREKLQTSLLCTRMLRRAIREVVDDQTFKEVVEKANLLRVVNE